MAAHGAHERPRGPMQRTLALPPVLFLPQTPLPRPPCKPQPTRAAAAAAVVAMTGDAGARRRQRARAQRAARAARRVLVDRRPPAALGAPAALQHDRGCDARRHSPSLSRTLAPSAAHAPADAPLPPLVTPPPAPLHPPSTKARAATSRSTTTPATPCERSGSGSPRGGAVRRAVAPRTQHTDSPPPDPTLDQTPHSLPQTGRIPLTIGTRSFSTSP